MKVLYIVNDLGYFRQHRENIAVALAAEGHEVIVAAGESNSVSVEDWPPSMTLIPLDLDRQHFNLFGDLRFIFSIRSLMKEHRPDLVHALTIKPVLRVDSRFDVGCKIRLGMDVSRTGENF